MKRWNSKEFGLVIFTSEGYDADFSLDLLGGSSPVTLSPEQGERVDHAQ